MASGGAAHLATLLIGGREIVKEGKIPGLDLAELGAQARTAVRKLLDLSSR